MLSYLYGLNACNDGHVQRIFGIQKLVSIFLNCQEFDPESSFGKPSKCASNHEQLFSIFQPFSNDFNMFQHVFLTYTPLKISQTFS